MLSYTHLPYHQQDTSRYCGVAVGQMMLRSFGLGIEQQDVVNGKIAFEPGWNTSPAGLCGLLTDGLRAANGTAHRGFGVCDDPDAASALRRAAAVLASDKWAVPANVFSGEHWVALTGVLTKPDPSTRRETVQGFYYNDPYKPEPAKRRHEDGDVCGGGGKNGACDAYATVYYWRTYYWDQPCAPSASARAGYVTICSNQKLTASETVLPADPRSDGPICSSEAAACASAAIDEAGIARKGPLSEWLAGYATALVNPVYRDDGTTLLYYAVNLRQGDALRGYALIDAATGTLLAVQAAGVFPDVSPRTLYATLHTQPDLRGYAGFEFTDEPVFCWTRGLGTASLFYPSVRAKLGREYMFYRLPDSTGRVLKTIRAL